MKKFCFSLILLFLININFATAADWPQFMGDHLHTAQSTETLEPPLSVKWTYSGAGKFISSASVKGGKVFIGSRDHSLYVLDESDGTVVWKFTAGNWIDSTPFVSDTAVYFSSRDGHLYCLNSEDGTVIWKYKTGGTDSSSPIVDGGLIFVGSGFPNKKIIALDALTGREVWNREVDQMVYSSPVVSGDNVYIGANDGQIYSLKKDNGEVNWSYKTNGGMYYASPSILGGKLFLAPGDFDWVVYGINIDNGQLSWSYAPDEAQETPTYVSGMAVGDNEVYVVSGYGQQYLYCLNAGNGSLKWKAHLGPATRFGFSSTPIVTAGTVYVATSSGQLKSFEVGTGVQTWEYDLGAKVLSSASLANGTLYIATLDGTLYALH